MVKNHSLPDQSLTNNEKDTNFEKCFFEIPYVGIDQKWFGNRLSELTKRTFENFRVHFVIFKINHYFQLKSYMPQCLEFKCCVSVYVYM